MHDFMRVCFVRNSCLPSYSAQIHLHKSVCQFALSARYNFPGCAYKNPWITQIEQTQNVSVRVRMQMSSLNYRRECENCFHVDFFIRFYEAANTVCHSIRYKDHYIRVHFFYWVRKSDRLYENAKQENTLSQEAMFLRSNKFSDLPLEITLFFDTIIFANNLSTCKTHHIITHPAF